MSDTDSWADGPYLSLSEDTFAMRHRISQLENDLEIEKMRTSELDHRLEEEILRRGILEVDLDHHKEALVKKCEEIKEREGTIEELNCLLGLAWADFQNQELSRQETEKAMVILKDYVEDMLTTTEPDGNANKKRRIGA